MPAVTAPVATARADVEPAQDQRASGRRPIYGRAIRWRLGAVLLAAAASMLVAGGTPCFSRGDEPAHSAELDAMIIRAAKRHGVPERLLRRIVMRESRYNPHARNHKYWGLMQISYPTARSMGFKGTPEELLNPLTNLTYAVPYLANAFIAAGKDESTAVRLYASGYYDTARRRGLLGMLRTADSTPVVNAPEPAMAQGGSQPDGGSLFGSLFGSSEPVAQPQIAAATQAGMVQPVTAAQVAADGAAGTAPHGAGALPEGKATRGGALLALDGSGRARPPAKWMHDGGLTVLARGEQGDRSFAATRVAAGEAAPAGRSRKTAVFASLDAPGSRPASAQAYAASASDETAPQAAISQALASPAGPSADAKPANTAADAAGKRADGAAPDGRAGKAEDDEAPRRKRHRHAHHRAKHGQTREADAGEAASEPKP